jgi:hypothetical protein
MITRSGVEFHRSGPTKWRAVLPEGPYLPCPVVVERDELRLSAHLQDTTQDCPCREEPDGRIRLDLHSGTEAEATFHPDTLEYGLDLGERTEGYAANGDWLFATEDLRVVETPSGQVTAHRGAQVMEVTTWPDRIDVRPQPFLTRLREQGLRAALWPAESFNSFLFRANGWSERLFPRLVEARSERETTRRSVAAESEVRRLAGPREPGAGVELSAGTVRVGATRLSRRR